MNISKYKKYISAETMMGPNCVRLLGELFDKYPMQLTSDDLVLDLRCGTGLTSLVIAKETGAKSMQMTSGSVQKKMGNDLPNGGFMDR